MLSCTKTVPTLLREKRREKMPKWFSFLPSFESSTEWHRELKAWITKSVSCHRHFPVVCFFSFKKQRYIRTRVFERTEETRSLWYSLHSVGVSVIREKLDYKYSGWLQIFPRFIQDCWNSSGASNLLPCIFNRQIVNFNEISKFKLSAKYISAW